MKGAPREIERLLYASMANVRCLLHSGESRHANEQLLMMVQIVDVNALPDPCPLPHTVKKRGLNEKERLLYAPMADVGGLLYDKDAVYIDIPDWKVHGCSRIFVSKQLTYRVHPTIIMSVSIVLQTKSSRLLWLHGHCPHASVLRI